MSLLFFCLILCIIFVFLFQQKPALAAIPPLNSESLWERAILVIVGKIEDVNKKEIPTSIGTDWLYKLNVYIEEIEQNQAEKLKEDVDISTPKSGEIINIYYWQIGKRPSGWTGPIGQYNHPEIQQLGRLFLNINEQKQWQLIEPNGWEKLT
jgi:hypothetical protein